MEIPIIIAARKEADHIGHTLDVLSKQAYEVKPIVIINGRKDGTADIAREAGATVLESPAGKMLAIQEGLRHLGKRALEPLLILDADTRPLSKLWSGRMVNELHDLSNHKPAIVWGPYVFSNEIIQPLGVYYTAKSMRVSWTDRHKDKPRTIRGGNTGLYINNDEVLEELLELNNYWPRADVAIFDTMKRHEANHKVIMSPQAWGLTSGFRIMDTIRKIIKAPKHQSKAMDDSYSCDAPAGSIPYFSETTDTVVHEKP